MNQQQQQNQPYRDRDPGKPAPKPEEKPKEKLEEPKPKFTASDAPLVFIAIVCMLAMRGLTLSLAWEWFVRPVFKMAPPIDFRAALGLVTFRAAVIGASRASNEEDFNVKKWIGKAVYLAVFDLAIVAIVHVLIGAVR